MLLDSDQGSEHCRMCCFIFSIDVVVNRRTKFYQLFCDQNVPAEIILVKVVMSACPFAAISYTSKGVLEATK